MTGRRSVIACSKSSRKSRHLSNLAQDAKVAAGSPPMGAQGPTQLAFATFAITRGSCLAPIVEEGVNGSIGDSCDPVPSRWPMSPSKQMSWQLHAANAIEQGDTGRNR